MRDAVFAGYRPGLLQVVAVENALPCHRSLGSLPTEENRVGRTIVLDLLFSAGEGSFDGVGRSGTPDGAIVRLRGRHLGWGKPGPTSTQIAPAQLPAAPGFLAALTFNSLAIHFIVFLSPRPVNKLNPVILHTAAPFIRVITLVIRFSRSTYFYFSSRSITCFPQSRDTFNYDTQTVTTSITSI